MPERLHPTPGRSNDDSSALGGMQGRRHEGASRRRGQVWFSRRLTRCGVHPRRAMEHCLGDDGHVTCGWSTDVGARVQHTRGRERCSQWLASPRRAGVRWAGKALQNDHKYASIHSPIVWWTHVCPQGGTGRHARSPAKENGRVLARLTHDRCPVVRVTLCLCPATLLPAGMALDRCLHRLVCRLCSTRGAWSVSPRHATPVA